MEMESVGHGDIEMATCSDIGYESDGCVSESNEEVKDEEVKVVTTEMFSSFKEELKEERDDFVRFVDYTIKKNKVDNVRFYKDHYSFSFKEKEEVREETTNAISGNVSTSPSNSYDKLKGYEVNIYPSYVTIKIDYNETMINGVDDIFEEYKETFFELFTKQEKLKANEAINDIYKISGLDLKKSREDKINSVLE